MISKVKPIDTIEEIPFPGWVSFESKQPLAREGDHLVSSSGNERFPIVDEIPRFVGMFSYVSAFGLQWNHYRRTQLDSYTGLPISRDRLRRNLGEDL